MQQTPRTTPRTTSSMNTNTKYRQSAQHRNRPAVGQRRPVGSYANRMPVAQSTRMESYVEEEIEHVVACHKCKSTKIKSVKKGYRYGRMLLALFILTMFPIVGAFVILPAARLFILEKASDFYTIFGLVQMILFVGCGIVFLSALPASVVVGLKGRNELLNACIRCGSKWNPDEDK